MSGVCTACHRPGVKVVAKGLCMRCYYRARRTGTTEDPKPKRSKAAAMRALEAAGMTLQDAAEKALAKDDSESEQGWQD